MRTWLPVRVERLWWLRGLRRLLRVLGTLPLVLDASNASIDILSQRRSIALLVARAASDNACTDISVMLDDCSLPRLSFGAHQPPPTRRPGLALADPDFGVVSGPGSATGAT